MEAAASTQDDAQLLLDVIGSLLAQLRPGHASTVALGSDLETDLGIDSLSVAELLVRVESAFGVVLPVALLSTATTPRDLLEAVRRAPQATVPLPARVPPRALAAAAGPPPDDVGSPAAPMHPTLVDSLRWHADEHPDRVHVRVLDEHGGEAATLTYGELSGHASAVARALMDLGVQPGDPVALMLPTGPAYFTTFMGVLLAGAVAVPIYPPDRPSRLAEHLGRQRDILANAGAIVLVTDPAARAMARLVRTQVPTMRHVRTPEELQRAAPDDVGPLPPVTPDGLALLQYTSGSTGDPKGVELTHHHLVANIDAMAQAIGAGPEDVFVSWLPLYHDMGLIGAWLGSLHVGMTLIALPPQAFLVRPASWLQAITAHGGTFTAAPNFAYELCLRRVGPDQLAGLDLRTLRRTFNGAETVDPGTVRRFTARFAPCGLRPQAMAPVYGLAEAAVGLAFPPQGRVARIDRIQRATFHGTGVARPAGPDAGPDAVLELVTCGQALPGYGIRVVDADGQPVPDRTEGRVQFRGPSATPGYRGAPEATARLVDGEWRNTGDLGYLAEGDLVVTGRTKDLIIRAGRNLHPQELERRVGGVDGVRAGCVAAFGVPDPDAGTERLVVVAETRAVDDPEARRTIRTAVVRAAAELLGLPPEEVVLVGPGTLPKTSSGKLRRGEAKARYLAGALQPTGRPGWSQLVRFATAGLPHLARRLGRRAVDVLDTLRAWVTVALLTAPMVVALLLPTSALRWTLARRATRAAAALVGARVQTLGAPLPDGPAVVVANHASWLDGFVMVTVLPGRLRLVAGEVLGERALQSWMLRRLDTVFVERHDRARGVADVDLLVDAARRGDYTVVFPEGGLAHLAGLRPFHLGAFAAAAQAQVPVVPVAVRGTRQAVPPGTRRFRRGPIVVVVGDPIAPGGTGWAEAVRLRDAARTHIATHCGETDLDPA